MGKGFILFLLGQVITAIEKDCRDKVAAMDWFTPYGQDEALRKEAVDRVAQKLGVTQTEAVQKIAEVESGLVLMDGGERKEGGLILTNWVPNTAGKFGEHTVGSPV